MSLLQHHRYPSHHFSDHDCHIDADFRKPNRSNDGDSDAFSIRTHYLESVVNAGSF